MINFGRKKSAGGFGKPNRAADDFVRDERVRRLPVDKIEPDNDQPRKLFDEVAIQELAEDIQKRGLLEPILVEPLPERPGRYRLVIGERRLRAHKLLDKDSIEAIERAFPTSLDRLEAQLAENSRRADLTPLEEAEALNRMKIFHGASDADLAKAVGKTAASVGQALKILELAPTIRERLLSDAITARALPASALVEIARTGSEDAQEELFNRALAEELSVRQIRAAREEAEAESSAASAQRSTPPSEQPEKQPVRRGRPKGGRWEFKQPGEFTLTLRTPKGQPSRQELAEFLRSALAELEDDRSKTE